MAAVCVHFCVCPRAECRRRSNIQSINNRARSRNFAHAVDRSADENERVLCMHTEASIKLKRPPSHAHAIRRLIRLIDDLINRRKRVFRVIS
jgi:hypothetical protein